jgi:hypothetical protein
MSHNEKLHSYTDHIELWGREIKGWNKQRVERKGEKTPLRNNRIEDREENWRKKQSACYGTN